MQARTASSFARSFGAVAALLAVSAAVPGAALADNPIADKLFDDGLKALNAHDYATACKDFEGSQRAEPSVGALINLGKCNEGLGNWATAYAKYKAASSLAHQRDDQKRAQTADESASAIEGKMSYVTVHLKTPVPGVVVTRDGQDIGGVFDTPLPIDAGSHQINASAAGYAAFTTTVTVKQGGDKAIVEIEMKPGAGPTPPGPGPVTGPPQNNPPPGTVPGTQPPPQDTSKGGISGLSIGGFVVGGVGAVGVVVGAIFGGMASGAKGDLDKECPNKVCSSTTAQDDLNSAKTDATIASAGLIGGGILLAGGATMVALGFVMGKKSPSTGIELTHSQSPQDAKIELVPVTGATNGLYLRGSF